LRGLLPTLLRPPQLALVPLVLVVGLGLGGCGSAVQLERTPGGPRYKAVPYKTEIKQVETADGLAQPTAVIGVLRTETRRGEEDRGQVQRLFLREAALAGCDAIVGLKADIEEKKSAKTVEQLGEGGKMVKVQKEVVARTARWTAQCVRTAALGVDPAAPAAAPPAAVEPAPSAPTAPPAAEPDTPEGIAAKELAQALIKRPAFVKGWSDRLGGSRPSAADVLDATVEVMVQVTGPTGLWRKTVPQEWFGCRDAPDSAACQRLGEIDKDLRQVDQFQAQIAAAPRDSAASWLRRHQEQLTSYLDTYVPTEPSLSSLQATPYYMGKMAGVTP
jgi:uncharacterized protein YceK